MKLLKTVALMLTLIMLIPVGTIWAADSGFKQRVAILEFEDKTDHGYWSAGKGIADILTTRLLKTGKYEIVERQRLDDVMAEQGLSDILDPATVIKPKQIKGIEVLIYGSVTLFNVKDTSVGIGRFRVGKSDADVEVQLRVVDATTGSILLADSSKARDSSPSVEIWGRTSIDFNSSNFQSSSLGKATNKVIDDLVSKITNKLAEAAIRPASHLEGYVILVKDGKVYIDLGKNVVKNGNKFNVIRPGETIIHPVTGEKIPGEATTLGTVTVTDAQEKLSKCDVNSGLNINDIKPGDKVESVE